MAEIAQRGSADDHDDPMTGQKQSIKTMAAENGWPPFNSMIYHDIYLSPDLYTVFF